MVQKKVPSSN